MIVHFDGAEFAATSIAFEHLALVLCQSSIHIALQLYFIFVAAMEDYQPENSNGMENPNANTARFYRCARLLHNVERVVVFGSPVFTADEEAGIAAKAHLTVGQMSELYDVEKLERVKEIVPKTSTFAEMPNPRAGVHSGILMTKRMKKKSAASRNNWKRRYFTIQNRVLYCYRNEQSTQPMRALALPDCIIETIMHEKYSYVFTVRSRTTFIQVLVRAVDQNSFKEWIDVLQK